VGTFELIMSTMASGKMIFWQNSSL